MEEFNIQYSNIIRLSFFFRCDISRDNDDRGFSDSLLASRQLYTEAPSHKLSAMLYEVRMKVLDEQRNMIKNVQVGLPVREEHDALEDAADCRRICRRMAGTQRSWQHTTVIQNYPLVQDLYKYVLLLGQCKFRFMDFIMDSNW